MALQEGFHERLRAAGCADEAGLCAGLPEAVFRFGGACCSGRNRRAGHLRGRGRRHRQVQQGRDLRPQGFVADAAKRNTATTPWLARHYRRRTVSMNSSCMIDSNDDPPGVARQANRFRLSEGSVPAAHPLWRSFHEALRGCRHPGFASPLFRSARSTPLDWLRGSAQIPFRLVGSLSWRAAYGSWRWVETFHGRSPLPAPAARFAEPARHGWISAAQAPGRGRRWQRSLHFGSRYVASCPASASPRLSSTGNPVQDMSAMSAPAPAA